MKKSIVASIAFAVTMAIVWSLVFITILGPAGVGVGIAFGTSFYFIGTMMFKPLDSKDKNNKP